MGISIVIRSDAVPDPQLSCHKEFGSAGKTVRSTQACQRLLALLRTVLFPILLLVEYIFQMTLNVY